jgi:hypothetical protein
MDVPRSTLSESQGSGAPPKPRPSIWLNGSVVACACPDCSAPMTVRLWLMTADCWRCGASIALSVEQEREVQRLLAERDRRQTASAPEQTPAPAAAPAKSPSAVPPPAPHFSRSTAPAPPSKAPSPKPAAPQRATSKRNWEKSTVASPDAARTGESTKRAADPVPARWIRWRDLTAWLASLVFHLILILLLGLWTLAAEQDNPRIVLSTAVGPQHREGGEMISERQQNETELDLPFEPEPPPEEAPEVVAARNDAEELQVDPTDDSAELPQLQRVRNDLISSDPYRRMLATRDPRFRAEIVEAEGGTTLTEAAVARALRWMSNHQNDDGSWCLHGFPNSPGCRGQCGGRGQIRSCAGGTALALLAYLGAGQTHKFGVHRQEVRSGLQWLISHQRPDGDLRADSDGNAGMYVHAQAAIVLCDAYKLTGDEALRRPAQRAIDFICDAQHSAGGWRYRPGQKGDTSVVGWQLMAMHSAKSAYLYVPSDVLDLAGEFLDTVQKDPYGAFYAYQPGRPATATMTAEALLSRMYLGWNRNDRGLVIGVYHLAEEYPPSIESPNIYYWYYATQVMHHWGGAPWESWNRQMREVLLETQVTSGHEAGSWDPRSPYAPQGGRLYMTSLAACTLEVYYRHAPLFRRIDLR